MASLVRLHVHTGATKETINAVALPCNKRRHKESGNDSTITTLAQRGKESRKEY
jgi:hypothetical protein